MASLEDLRLAFHRELVEKVIVDRGLYGAAGREKHEPPVESTLVAGAMVRLYSNADGHSEASARLAEGLALEIAASGRRAVRAPAARLTVKASGTESFEELVAGQIERSLALFGHIHRAHFQVTRLAQRGRKVYVDDEKVQITSRSTIADFHAYRHLWYLATQQQRDPRLRAAIGGDYLVRPDIVVWRRPFTSEDLNAGAGAPVVDDGWVAGSGSPAWEPRGATRLPILLHPTDRGAGPMSSRRCARGSVKRQWPEDGSDEGWGDMGPLPPWPRRLGGGAPG